MKTSFWPAVAICLMTAFTVLAQAPTPIGKVDAITGQVVAISPDGSQIELAQGDPVYQGYTIVTGEDSAIGVILNDESVFSLDEIGSLTLDSMVYDPDSSSGTAVLSLAKGIFTFVSGQIAKMAPDAMVLKTPSALIGIRGTAAGLTVDDFGATEVTMLEEADGDEGGEVIVSNEGGFQTLNTPYQATRIRNIKSRPSKPFKIALQEIGVRFGGAMRLLPRAKKLIHKKIRDETARQFKTLAAKKAARRTRLRLIKRNSKDSRTLNIMPTFKARTDTLGMARKGAANRMRDALKTRPRIKAPRAKSRHISGGAKRRTDRKIMNR